MSDLLERIKKSRVFILGAGFSCNAGIPLTQELLEESLQSCSIECEGMYYRIKNCIDTIKENKLNYDNKSSVSFSDLCTYIEYNELREFGGGERWCENGSKEKLALRYFLSKTVAKRTPNILKIPQLYKDFANQLHENDIVITFNWDCLLELALMSVGKSYTYNGNNRKAIKIFKLHGSVNWRLGQPRNVSYEKVNSINWKKMYKSKGLMDKMLYHSELLMNFNNWSSSNPFGEVQPFIVLPGLGKAYDVRANARNWYKPEFAFWATHDIFIIGLSLADDDFFIKNFFLSILLELDNISEIPDRKVFIVNPDKCIANKYNFLAKKHYVEFVIKEFNHKTLELIQGRLKSNC